MTGTGNGRFEGAIALVTGGGSGIGAAVVRQLDREGGSVIYVADVDEDGAKSVAATTRSGRAVVLDVTVAADVEARIGRIVAEHGRLDVVVNCAGVDDPRAKARILAAQQSGEPVDVFRHLEDDQWLRVMRVNLDGTFHVLRAAVRAMIPARRGAIVTVGSSAAFDTLTGYAHYAASKAGAHALAQSVAKEAAAFGVRVNVVAPGPVDTPMAARTPAAVREALAASGPVGYASPDELADNILYLASPGASNVVGAVLLSNGGRFTV
ncbi:SDR family NAD(P)-dependent oxidoreductase [Nonomuraea basaltis]|uniref:SDR family NAD(P)-dependent oxidoreductase n=1 Tax=Nonomuraea basaltis TaxID=2495887 RepID=UPI00110C5C0F|nr:SDR family NAD(P)-dependent oxidoreductase [Nonomuraea basaltis]TMR94041.1 SDR family oxidoreductase [Nonomuraea basaltis]